MYCLDYTETRVGKFLPDIEEDSDVDEAPEVSSQDTVICQQASE